jgi:transglutaminase-like putative cysteine protease
MRIRLQLAVLLGVLALPGVVLAQFQAPTEEELKMTAEPKAPGASAIYLYREEKVDDMLHYHSLYVRIKVLTEKGKELATVSVPYLKGEYKISDVQARTIHADGKVIPLDVKPADLMEAKVSGFQVNKVVFTLPDVEVGSILEYRWQLRYSDETVLAPNWEIQQPYYVRKAHYFFVKPRDLDEVTDSRGSSTGRMLISANLPAGVKVGEDVSGRYSLDVTDVKPLPDEEFMPPVNSWMERVTFYYTPYTSKEEYWKKEGERWSKEMDHFAGETKTLKEAVAKIVAPGDTDEVKAHKLYDAVMALENTDYTRKKSDAELKQQHLREAKNAEDVWNQKSGGSDQIALLYLTMARIAGLKANALYVCNRNRAIFNPFYLSMDQFDDVLVTVTINGKEVPLDPGKRFASFGELDWRHTMTGAMHQTDKGTALVEMPAMQVKDAATLRVANLTIGRDGSVTGTARISMNGPAAVRWREMALQDDEAEVKKQFNEELKGMMPDGVTAEFDHFLGLEDFHSQLMGTVKISGTIATATGKRVFLPAMFFESHARHPFVAVEKRETAVDMQYADVVQDEVTYQLPEGFTVESAPAEASVPWTGHAAFRVKTAQGKNEITVTRVFARGFTLLDPKEYSDLREYFQKVATADQQQLVLTTAAAPAAKGNGQ